MNTLAVLRGDLQQVLEGTGTTVLDHLPERLAPPVAVIAAGSPYIEPGETFGSWTVRHTVVLVCSPATNVTATRQLDSIVSSALVALDAADWGIERVDQPTMLAHGNAHFLSTTIDVLRRLTGINDGSP